MRRVLVAVLLLFGLMGATVLWAERALALTEGGNSGARIVEIPRGANARQVGRILREAGLINSESLWRYLLWRRGGLHVMAGRFNLAAGSSVRSLASALEGPPLPEDEPFTVVEGWRIVDSDAALASAGVLLAGEYVRAAADPAAFKTTFPLPADSLEGYLYPETYRVEKTGLGARALIQRQLDTFAERVLAAHQDEIGKSRRTLADLVKMASLLEKEEPDPDQRHLVAGILWNRIDRGMSLGVDATSRYRLAQWNDVRAFRAALGDASDPYNTRSHNGLPPTAIGAVSKASFEAALHPTETDFLYYLHDADRHLHPSRTLKEHEELRRKYGLH